MKTSLHSHLAVNGAFVWDDYHDLLALLLLLFAEFLLVVVAVAVLVLVLRQSFDS